MPFFNLLPHERHPSIFDLDVVSLNKRGIEGLLFDIDNTITVWGVDSVDERMADFITELKAQGFRIAFISNAAADERPGLHEPLSPYPVVYDAAKPLSSGFKKVSREMGLMPHKIAVVGDQLFTDIMGANRLGFYTIFVEPVGPDIPGFSIKLRRFFEKLILLFWRD